MSVKTQRKSNADAVAYKVKPTSKVRGSASKATSRSNGNGKHPLSSYEHLHVGVVQTSLKGKYMEVNEEFCRILGYSKEDLLQMSAKDCTHEDDYALDLKLHEQLVAGKIPFYALEKRYIRKDGQLVWVELTRSLVRDEKGKPLCTMGVVTDISEYKQVERVLRESAENLRIATEAARMFKWELDFQKQLYTFADNFVQVLGFSGGLFPQNSVETVWRLSPEEDVLTISKAIDKAIKNHSDLSSLQYRMINPENGQTVWLEANAKIVYDAKGNALRMFGVAQNITEEKRTQEEIRILSKLPEENPNPVMRLTPEGNVLYANDPSTHLLEVWKQQTDDAILQELQKHIAETFASGSRKEIELSQNGKTFSFTLAPIREAGYVNLYGIDITLRKQVEEALRAKESELQEIINRTPFMLTRCSRDLRYRFVSNAYARMIGRTPEEVAGKPILEIMGEKGLRTISPYIEKVLQGEQVEYEIEVPFEGSGAPSLHVIYTPDRDEQGNVIGWFASIIDITERERTEQVLAEFARQQEALYQLSDQLHHTDSLAEVYESALNAILSALQCDRASILLFDDTNLMRFVAWRGLSEEYRQATEGHSPWNSDEKNPYPICIGDVHASDLSDSLKATIQKEGIASLAFIPLVLNGKLIGKFMVYFDALHECSDNEIELSLMIARQVAFGIDRKLAEESLRVRARQQQAVARLGELAVRERDLQKVFDHTAGIVAETLDIEYCEILELLENKDTLLLRAGVGWKQGLVGKATMSAGMGSQAGYTLLSDTPVVVADFREEQRFNGPPLLMDHGVISGMTCILYGVNGTPWGVVGAHATRRTNSTQNDVNFLTAVANILSDAIQRQQADQALWQSEERYRAVVESQAEMLCRFKPDGTILFVNEAYARARGTTVEKLIHANFWEFVAREDRPALQTMLENLTSEAPEARVENRFQTFEGERWTLWTNRALGFDASGHVLEAQATGIDITDRKHTEEKLRESEERYRTIVDTANEGIWYIDLNATTIYLNEPMANILGYSAEEVIGRKAPEFCFEEDVPKIETRIRGNYQGNYENFDFRFRRKDGSEVLVLSSTSPVRDVSGKIIGALGMFVDITDRRRAEEQLRASEERLRVTFNTAVVGFATLTPQARFVEVNDAFCEIVGYTRAELLEMDCAALTHPFYIESTNEHVVQLVEGKVPSFVLEKLYIRKDGRQIWVQNSVSLVRDADGAPRHLIAICQDITERKQAEEQLQKSAEFDAFRVALTDALRPLNDPEKILAEAMRVLGEKLQVERVLYSEITEDDETILILDNYVKEGVARLTGQASLNDYGKARRILEAGQNLIIMDATTSPDMDEKDRASFAAIGIRSGLAIPLIKNGRWAATLGVHHGSLRDWSENEVKFVEETAERTWSALERARSQEKLRASETLYRTIARSIPGGGVYVVDKDFRYLVAEGPVTETFGLSRDMLEGRTVWEAFPGERGERMRERLQRTYEGETVNFETEYDGRVYWTQQAPLQDSIGQAIIVTIEITERKRAEEALRIENERFMRFVNSNIVGILIGDAQGKVVLANDYYLRLLGVSRQDLLEEKVDWRQFTPPEWLPADEKAIQELRERGVCEPYEKEYIRTDGTRVPVYIADALLPGPGGEIAAFVLDITGRKQAEEALRQSEERFARFMQHLPGLAWIKDVQGRYVYANAAAEAAFSIPREKLYGRTDLEVFSSESADQFRKNDEQALISEKGMQTVETLHQVDGVLHYSLVTKFPIPGPDGKAAWIGGTAFDITERLQAEEELRKSEERYRGLFDLVPIAVYTCDANGLIQEYNQRAVELWGREPKINDPQETRYCGSYKLYYPDGRLMPHENSPMSRVLAGETLDRAETEILVERPDGSRRHAIAHPLLLRDEHGQIIEAINCLYDITEHKQAEEALRESEGRFSAILRQATAGIVRKDMEGRFIFVNQAFCNMLGYTEEELLGKNFWQFTYHEDIPENKRLYDRMMREGIPFKLEKRVIRQDGSIIWIDVSVAPVMDAEGKPQSAVAVEVDITGRKQAEEALQQLNMQLESRVQKRTATIQAMNQSLRDEIAERKRVEEALRVSEATALASEEKLRTLFDLLPVGISFLDPDGKVLQMNSALLNIVKLSKEELLGQKYLSRKYIRADGTPMPFTEFAAARALAEAKTIYNVETGIVLEDGDVIWTSVSAAPVDVADVSVVVVTVDITDSKRAEQALQESHARLRILSQRLVEVQEEERRALARELHDRVGQTLAALNINLIIINSQLSTEVVQQIGARLSDSMKLVGETIALVRDVMTDLRPAVLDDYGLEAALEAHLSGFQSRYNIQVAFEKPERPIPRLGPSIEMTFLRIAQEALINIAKHAHAGRVDLSLREEAEAICLTIQDNGTGIESWQHANRPGSHGLTIMRERAEAFGGTLKVKSVPDQGTVVEASIPFRKSEDEEQKKN